MERKPVRPSFHVPRLEFLGTLRGAGELCIGPLTGQALYEIDGYKARTHVSANGRIRAERKLLAAAYAADEVRLILADGQSLRVSLPADPSGDDTAEIEVDGGLPEFRAA